MNIIPKLQPKKVSAFYSLVIVLKTQQLNTPIHPSMNPKDTQRGHYNVAKIFKTSSPTCWPLVFVQVPQNQFPAEVFRSGKLICWLDAKNYKSDIHKYFEDLHEVKTPYKYADQLRHLLQEL